MRGSQARDGRFWKSILEAYDPGRKSRPEPQDRNRTCFCGTVAQGHRGTDHRGQTAPPTPFPRLNMVGGGHGGPACDKDEEECRMAINLLLAHLPCGSAAEAPGLNLRSKENYVAFPLSHHESADLDKTKLW